MLFISQDSKNTKIYKEYVKNSFDPQYVSPIMV